MGFLCVRFVCGLLIWWWLYWLRRTASLGSRKLADQFLFLVLITVRDKICRQTCCSFYIWSCCMLPAWLCDRCGIIYATPRATLLYPPDLWPISSRSQKTHKPQPSNQTKNPNQPKTPTPQKTTSKPQINKNPNQQQNNPEKKQTNQPQPTVVP